MDSFADYLTHTFGSSFGLGSVAYERKSTGPDTDRRVVRFGLGQVRIDGVPLMWLQRTAQPRYGRELYTLEVLCPAGRGDGRVPGSGARPDGGAAVCSAGR